MWDEGHEYQTRTQGVEFRDTGPESGGLGMVGAGFVQGRLRISRIIGFKYWPSNLRPLFFLGLQYDLQRFQIRGSTPRFELQRV